MIKHKYDPFIRERYNDLIISKKEINNFDLATLFELYSCVKLEEIYKQPFFMNADIDPTFKEVNNMSRDDTGIDCCNLIDTIVQCKLRSKSLTYGDCTSFFASQNQRDLILNKTIVRWNNLIVTRNSGCTLSKNLKERLDFKMFVDHPFDKQEMITYCEHLIENPPVVDIKENAPKFELRDYQIECVDLIKNNNQNIIICIPTGTWKNVVIIYNFLNDKKYLILVPRVILTEQLRDEIIKHYPKMKNKIQIIGDGNEKFDIKHDITICVYNSVSAVTPYLDTFHKIFIDEAHHINKPEIYREEDDEQINEVFINNKDDKPQDDKPQDDKPQNNFVVVNFNEIINGHFDDVLNKMSDDDKSNESFESDDNELNDSFDDDDKSEDSKDDTEDELHKEKYIKTIKSLTKYNNNVYLSATIDDVDGFLYYQKDIREMIDKGYLCDYTIHVPIFSESPNNKRVCEYLINNYRTMIVYCESQKEGTSICKLFNEIQNKSAEYIDCYTTKKTRHDIIRRYKNGEIPFLVNVRVLTEGFDAPVTQGVIFMHLPSSKTTLIQIIGRALRLHPNKMYAKIVLPFSCKDDESNINNFLKVIAKNDSRIRKAYENKTLGGYIDIEKVKFEKELEDDIKEDVEENEDDKDIEFKYEQVFDSMGMLRNGDEIWERKLEQVKQYIDENQKRPSRTDNNNESESLGTWIHNQQQKYKNKTEIMKNQEIYDQWTVFINSDKYKKYFVLNDEKWYINFERVKKYIDENNDRPSIHDKNKEIKILAKWIGTQKYNFIKKIETMKDIKKYKLWTEFINDNKYKIFFISNEEEWLNSLKQVKQYMSRNNKRPSQHDKNKEIKILGSWMSHQQTNYKTKSQIMSNQEIYDQWTNFVNDDKYKVYFISDEETWNNNLDKVKKYIDENNEDLKILGSWISCQQMNYKMKLLNMSSQKIYDQWTNFINDDKYKKYFMSNDEKWITNLELVKKYINENNKRPSGYDMNEEIKKLGLWIYTQTQNYITKINIMLDQKIYDQWTNFINDDKYKKYFISNDEEWYIKFKQVKHYIDENHKRPSQYDKNNDIKTLGSWIWTCLRNYKTKSCIMSNQNIFDQWINFINDDKYKIYFMSNDEEWLDNLERVKHYIEENNKRPSKHDKNNEIKILGAWISTQQANYKSKSKIMSNQKVYDQWSEFVNDDKYKKCFISNNEEWYTNLENVKLYIEKNNKRPSTHDKKNEIKILSSWISHQQENYKKKSHIMKDPSIRNHFTQFLTENKQYFPNVEIQNIEIKLNQRDPNIDNMIFEIKKYVEDGIRWVKTLDRFI
jgi:superfamily II DNA or RNA helicase